MTKENRVFEMTDEEYAAYSLVGPQEDTIDWEEAEKTTNLRFKRFPGSVHGTWKMILQQEVILHGNHHTYPEKISTKPWNGTGLPPYRPDQLYMSRVEKTEWWDVPVAEETS